MVAVRSLPLPVRCVNCGGSDSLALVGVIIAVAALAVALGALYIAAREHREFMKQLRARARFELTLDLEQGDGGSYETEAGSAILTVRVGLKNVGDRAAGETVLNVLTPATPAYLVWSTQTGLPLSVEDDVATTAETLTMPSGNEVAAHYITKTITRVALRPGQVAWFRVDVSVPSDLPVRVYAQSDDLPDDQEQVRFDRTFQVRSTASM